MDCALDLPNQRVIKADAERTRITDIKSLFDEFKVDFERQAMIDNIEKALTFYTRMSNTSYKQGYNEVLGVFLWLSYLNEFNGQISGKKQPKKSTKTSA
jgi:hypothetical protein